MEISHYAKGKENQGDDRSSNPPSDFENPSCPNSDFLKRGAKNKKRLSRKQNERDSDSDRSSRSNSSSNREKPQDTLAEEPCALTTAEVEEEDIPYAQTNEALLPELEEQQLAIKRQI